MNGHSKSLLTSQIFPSWYLGRHPNEDIIISSYSGSLAWTFSKRAMQFMHTPAFKLAFGTPEGGGVALDPRTPSRIQLVSGYNGNIRAAGVQGSITGHGAHLYIIDDPIKDAQQAMSERQRENLWNWFRSVAYTRLMPGGRMLVIATRWHEDDLIGRLLTTMREHPDESDQWHVINFPAISDDNQPLWPAFFDLRTLERIRATVGTRVWNALYQGQPSPDEGTLFKRTWVSLVDAPPVGEQVAARLRYWDFASSDDPSADWTVGLLMSMTSDGVFTIENLVRGQYTPAERMLIMRQTAELDRMTYGNVEVWFEQEGGSSGVDVRDAVFRALAGFSVTADKPRANKIVRFDPFRAQAQVGNVRLVKAPWNGQLLNELSTFPFGRHDDIVDTCSGALNALAGRTSNFVAYMRSRYGFADPSALAQSMQRARAQEQGEGGWQQRMTELEREVFANVSDDLSALDDMSYRAARQQRRYLLDGALNGELVSDLLRRKTGFRLERLPNNELARHGGHYAFVSDSQPADVERQLTALGLSVIEVIEDWED